ncbi:MAG: hypothetical protein WD648_15915 [Planctomycetaceae bacterium]
MRSRRRVIALTIALAAAGGLAWRSTESLSKLGAPTAVEVGECYAVECADDACTLDLDFSPSTRYVLIVGSLDSARHLHRVTFQAQPVGAVSQLPLTRIEPLEAPSHHASGGNALSHAGRGILESSDANCSNSTSGSIEAPELQPSEREFFIHVTDGCPDDPRQYARVSAKCVAEGRHVRVYLDSQQSTGELAYRLVDEVVWLFDTVVLPTARKNLGCCRDVDGDGKFTILLSPWLDRLQGGRTSLGGFVREGDFRADLESPYSNHCDMLCLNTNLQPDSHLCTLLMHEFTHAVCFSERLSSEHKRYALPAEEDWLNEAMAHVSENLIGSKWSNLDYRISRFLDAPQDYPLVVEDYFRTGMWRNHGCRGATYLFLRWCVDQYGEGLLRRLIRSPARGARSLEWATGQPFDELFRRWTIALYKSGRVARENVADATTTSPSDAAVPRNPGQYRTLDLCGTLSDWVLAGPRTHHWSIDNAGQELTVHGTAPAFLELTTNGRAGIRRIAVRGDYGSRLQVSLLRLDDDWPRLFAQAKWIDSDGSSNAGAVVLASAEQSAHAPSDAKAPGNHRLIVHVMADNEHGCDVEAIACERNFGETRESACFSGETLQLLRQPTALPIDPRHSAVFELPIPPLSDVSDGQARHLCVKVVSRDADGRRTTAWLTLGDPDSPPLEFTSAADDTTRH